MRLCPSVPNVIDQVERESSERAKGGEEGGEASRGGETQRPEAGEWEHVETPGAEGGSKPAATTGNSPPRGPAKAAAVGDAEGENVGDCHKVRYTCSHKTGGGGVGR